MSDYKQVLLDLIQKYKKWVRENPLTAAEVEATFKWVSLFLAGRIEATPYFSEFAYTISNLLVFVNDRIIAVDNNNTKSTSADRLKSYLTVLEYSEVLLEVTAKTKWGDKGKWRAIWVIQLVKSTIRLILLIRHQCRLLESPAIPSLRRGGQLEQKPKIETVSFTLKHSGRVIRKVQAAPPVGGRSWKPVDFYDNKRDFAMTRVHFAGELAFILRPLLHLTTQSYYGHKTWQPWMLSFVCDAASLFLIKRSQQSQPIGERERAEVSRRTLLLLLYLMRSPFYDSYSKNRIDGFLEGCANFIPLARFIVRPLQQYLPYWQDTYGYTWST